MPSFALSSHVKIHIKGRDLCGNWKTRALDLDSQTVPSVTVFITQRFLPSVPKPAEGSPLHGWFSVH